MHYGLIEEDFSDWFLRLSETLDAWVQLPTKLVRVQVEFQHPACPPAHFNSQLPRFSHVPMGYNRTCDQCYQRIASAGEQLVIFLMTEGGNFSVRNDLSDSNILSVAWCYLLDLPNFGVLAADDDDWSDHENGDSDSGMGEEDLTSTSSSSTLSALGSAVDELSPLPSPIVLPGSRSAFVSVSGSDHSEGASGSGLPPRPSCVPWHCRSRGDSDSSDDDVASL